MAWNSADNLLEVVEANGVLASMNGTTGQVLQQTYLGGTLGGLAIDPQLNRIYVADTQNGFVDVVSGKTAGLLAQVPVGVTPLGVAYDPLDGDVYVANSGSSNLSIVSAGMNAVVGSLPGGAGPSWVAVNTQNGHLFVSNTAACSATAAICNVTVIDPTRASIVATVQVGNGPTHLLFDNATNQVWVAVANAVRVAVIGGSTNLEITSDSVKFGTNGNSAIDVALDTANNRVYVTTHFNIVEINGTKWKITNTSFPGFVPTTLAFSPTFKTMLVADVGTSGAEAALIHVFDPAGQTYGATFQTYDAPSTTLYNSYNRQLYVMDRTANRLDILNASTGRLLSEIPGLVPGGLAFNPLNGSVFVSQGHSIDVFSGSTNRLTMVLHDSDVAGGLAYAPGHRDLYAADSNGNITVIDVASNSTVANIPFTGGFGGSISGILYDASRDRVYADTSTTIDQYGDASWEIAAINASTHHITTSAIGTYLAGPMAVDPRNGELYVVFTDPSGASNGWINAFNLSTLAYLDSPGIGGGTGIAWAATTGDIYVTNGGSLTELVTATDTVGSSLLVSAAADGAVFDSASRTVWVTSPESGTLSIVVP
jgi:YVTN family beta-propeller protein